MDIERAAAQEAAVAALGRYAAPGRSALIRIRSAVGDWEQGVDPDHPHRAASLLKLGIAMAAESDGHDGAFAPDATITVQDLQARPGDHSALDLLDPLTVLRHRDVLALMIGASDNACARWLASAVGMDAVAAAIATAGCTSTRIERQDDPGQLVSGVTSCRDALDLLRAASDGDRFPITSHALRHSIRNSRIPLGATDADVRISHKTGSLSGLAHDVALIECDAGTAEIAFLTDRQHDTLVAGYAMGICTREVLTAWGLATRSTVSVDGE